MKNKLYKKARAIASVLRHRGKYVTPEQTYYPEEPQKSASEIIRDHIGHILRYGYPIHDYYPQGLDVKGKRWQDYIPAYYNLKVQANVNKAWAKSRRGYNYVFSLDDKWSFAEIMEANGFPVPETVGLLCEGKLMRLHNQGAFEDIDVLRARTGRFLLKPVRGLSGKGIIILDIADGRFVADGKEVSSDELRAMVKEGKYLIQPFVTNQHPRIKAIFDKSLNTVRVTMVRTEKGVETLGCMFMTGASDSAYSNWHFGGICMYVDENGRLGKYGYSMSKKRITAHPDSGVVFEGFELPYFRETLRLCEQAMDVYYGMKTVGWDIALTEDGPIFLEGNAGWGVIAHQMVEHRGWADKFRKYFSTK